MSELHPAPSAPRPTPAGVAACEPSDRELLGRLLSGEEAAFEQLVRENTGRMFAVAFRILHAEEDARDAVQEAFLQAFRGLAGFGGQARLSTWLQRIAINASLMRLRSRRRKPEVAIEDLLPKFHADGHRVDPGPAWSRSALMTLESDETRALVREQIERLPEDHRNVLILRDINDFDTAETAAVLGITPAAAKVRLHRARQALRTLLEPHFQAGGP